MISKALTSVRESWFAVFATRYKFTFPYIIAVILIYIWLISSGTWVTWVSPTRYYANLARGFENGVLHIPSKPPAALLTLPDPYDHAARAVAGIETPIDISYYNGKYYLYWGPVPALMLAAISPFYSGRVGDLQLVFVFLVGVFLMQVFLVVVIWDRFFQRLPTWMLPVSIFVIGLSSPVTFMLDNISGARIYEAAITGAQFFLVGGFLAAFNALNGTFRIWKVFLAGIFWALAIGSRQTVALAVGFMVLAFAFAYAQNERGFFGKIKGVAALALPLAAGIVCLGWYNWARFGSVFETGLYYQMNYGFVHYNTHELTGYKYIFQNLYNYWLMPFGVYKEFPFLRPELGNTEEILFFSKSPSIYSAQIITGLLYSVPFVIFSIIPFVMLFVNGVSALKGNERILYWTGMTLSGASFASLAFLLIFFWAAMRYTYDFMPFLISLSVIGFWQGYSFILDKPIFHKIYAAFGGILAVISIVVSALLAISVNDARFAIIRLFSGFH